MHISKPTSGLLTHFTRPAVYKRTYLASLSSRSTSTSTDRKEGDIPSVFVSLSGDQKAPPLPERFADQKKRLIAGHEDQLKRSWDRLLCKLRDEIGAIVERGFGIIPSIDFKDLHVAPKYFHDELKKRGVAVIRGVISETEARGYKDEIEAYVQANPDTKGL
ncbi:uncharacterized protein N7477_005870 [Penicillium maclennaniae]|uniref:uncharacterized protein n=1 Tax=Penicillium maclennaniae TaxID=1343394 RepID=UPI00253F95AB|nr:uncharacterized protein N7477_005870 [Penicillium maclennaniae]KAJ5670507.1 hypothetical protein N7477_005870 [Penicillium maclennaniae]